MIAVPTPVANATLRYNEWKLIDEAVIGASMERLRVVADLRGAGLTYNIPNGMGKTVLVTQMMGDITNATISMDPARSAEGDRPEFDLANLPLPVIHKDFYYTARQIEVSRNGGTPLDVTTAQLAARKVAEQAEQLALGTLPTYSYGGGTIYGLTNYPKRITRTITSPLLSSWVPAVLVQQVLAMRQDSMNAFHFGPWVLYNSPFWDQYFDDDYSKLKGDITLRNRLLAIQGINDVRTVDFLTGKQLLLVQQTSDVVRMVVGMDITTVQWNDLGGMRVNFKVMAILVPQLRADINSRTGIVHATAT
jgi:uncharacterized linocin/CFP29 family protein